MLIHITVCHTCVYHIFAYITGSESGAAKPTLRLLQTGDRAAALRRSLGAMLAGRSLYPEILLVSDNATCLIGSDRLYLHMVEDRTSAQEVSDMTCELCVQ